VSTGAAGAFSLRNVKLDYGFATPSHLPANSGIRTPVRYSGTGQLQLNEHVAGMSERRMRGTITADLSTRDGQNMSVNAAFRFPLSCGVDAN
jgi:hypothetical protein